MTNFARLLAAAAATGALAAPAAAQYYPQQTYTQQYQYPQQQYQYPQAYGSQQGYGYQQGYGGNAVSQIIDQLLGNRYNITDRQAISQCATAALAQAQSQYGGYGSYGGYNGYQQQGYGQRYGQQMRVTAITAVERHSQALRVRGMISSGNGAYGSQYGYQNRGYSNGDLSFRCNVDYRGYVNGIRISRSNGYRGY